MFWYNDEVEALETKKVEPKGEKQRVLFYGSSSIRLWPNLKDDFPEFEVVNQAFGGSTLAACSWFFKRLVPQFKPDIIVFYAGDNDLGDGRHPEEVFFFFQSLMKQIKDCCGDIPVAFISVKPSFSRQHLKKSIAYTNIIIRKEIKAFHPNCTFVNIYDEMLHINKSSRTLFEEDGLHMSKAGYEVWKRILKNSFLDHFITPKPDSFNL